MALLSKASENIRNFPRPFSVRTDLLVATDKELLDQGRLLQETRSFLFFFWGGGLRFKGEKDLIFETDVGYQHVLAIQRLRQRIVALITTSIYVFSKFQMFSLSISESGNASKDFLKSQCSGGLKPYFFYQLFP